MHRQALQHDSIEREKINNVWRISVAELAADGKAHIDKKSTHSASWEKTLIASLQWKSIKAFCV